jgi:hypothetical protein
MNHRLTTESPFPALERPALMGSLLAMLVLALIVFGDVLIGAGPIVLSMFGNDLSDLFVYTRRFGFGELRLGNFPLWNPYLFCGIPFFGLFQDALLYPFSLPFRYLPLALAINWSIVFHVLLLGFFMYLWAGYRGGSPSGSLLAAVLVMFGGATYLHIFGGHLNLILAMPWTALILLVMEGGGAGAARGMPSSRTGGGSALLWGGIGAVAVCLQTFAGHPQTVFVTAIAAFLYVVCRVAGDVRQWRRLPFFAAVYAAGALLGAVQLAAGVAANQDSIRGSGVYYKFAAMFSFPPENFLTTIVPGFFGDFSSLPYWGRCYLWEMNLFLGVTGIVLLAAGIGRSLKKRQATYPAVTAMLIVLALGRHTPLFHWLYANVPGFDLFRGSSKFMLPAFLFMIMMAACGYDRIGQEREGRNRLAAACLGVSLLLLLGGILLWRQGAGDSAGGLWCGFLKYIDGTRESFVPSAFFQQGDFVSGAARLSMNGLLTAAVLFLAVGLLVGISRKTRYARHALLLMAAGELVMFARHYQPTFDINRCFPADIMPVIDSLKPGERILQIGGHNAGMTWHAGDLWGNHPGIRRRYAELMAAAQGYDPGEASQYLTFRKMSPVFSMLRCRAVITDGPDGKRQAGWLPSPLPRAFLVGACRVMPGRDEILRHVTSPDFNPLAEVVLESEPVPRPSALPDGVSAGEVTVLNTTTDSIDLAVNTPRPAILVVTDTFSRGWEAEPLETTAAQEYVIMPANYALRAIPLREGRHKIRLIYRPALFRTGLALSVSGWALFLAVWPLMMIWKSRAKSHRGKAGWARL